MQNQPITFIIKHPPDEKCCSFSGCFILVDTNEVWKHSNRITLASYAPAPPPVSYIRRTTSNSSGIIPDPGYQQLIPVTVQEGITLFSYINKNRGKLTPLAERHACNN